MKFKSISKPAQNTLRDCIDSKSPFPWENLDPKELFTPQGYTREPPIFEIIRARRTQEIPKELLTKENCLKDYRLSDQTTFAGKSLLEFAATCGELFKLPEEILQLKEILSSKKPNIDTPITTVLKNHPNTIPPGFLDKEPDYVKSNLQNIANSNPDTLSPASLKLLSEGSPYSFLTNFVIPSLTNSNTKENLPKNLRSNPQTITRSFLSIPEKERSQLLETCIILGTINLLPQKLLLQVLPILEKLSHPQRKQLEALIENLKAIKSQKENTELEI